MCKIFMHATIVREQALAVLHGRDSLHCTKHRAVRNLLAGRMHSHFPAMFPALCPPAPVICLLGAEQRPGTGEGAMSAVR